MMGNDPQEVKDEEVRQALAGLKMLEGGWRSGSEGAGGNIPYGFDQLPSGNETAGGTVDIGPGGVSGRQGQATAGNASGWEWAQNVNVSQSYQDARRTTSTAQGKTGLQNKGLTMSERAAAADSDDRQKQTVIASQGKATAQGISNVQQEGRTAQDTNRIVSQTAIGTVVAGGLMGGLSSGVATGLEGFFGTVGKGAGEQVSVKTGILPPSPTSPGSEPATGTASSPLNEGGASTGSDAGSGAVASTGTGTSTGGISSTATRVTTKPSTGAATGTGSSAGGASATGTGTSMVTKSTSQTTSMTYTGTVRETWTSTARLGKQGTLDCSHTASIKVTLHTSGLATAEQNGGVRAYFDINGNAVSCVPDKKVTTYTGRHQNGRVTLGGSGGGAADFSYSGQYTATSLTASGGGSQSGVRSVKTGEGNFTGGTLPGTTNMTGSMSLKRQ